MKIHVDTLNSRLETDNPDILRALYELYSFKIPGAEYSAAYKRRQWDGKTHFISKSGVFKSGLLSRLLADLKKIDCEPEIINNTWKTLVPEDFSPQDSHIDGFKYYDYQEALIKDGLLINEGLLNLLLVQEKL